MEDIALTLPTKGSRGGAGAAGRANVRKVLCAEGVGGSRLFCGTMTSLYQIKIENQGSVLRLVLLPHPRGPNLSTTSTCEEVSASLGSSVRFHAFWLRDNALDALTRDPRNGQRLITLADLPEEVKILNAHFSISNSSFPPNAESEIHSAYLELPRDRSLCPDLPKVAVTLSPENRTFEFPLAWLLENAYGRVRPESCPSVRTPKGVTLWDSNQIETLMATTRDLETLKQGGEDLRVWLESVWRFGFVKVSGVPAESGGLFSIVDAFGGFVRETNYGRLFEVRTELNPTNLAYTGLGLQAHTDNPYRDPAPTLQILSCIENSCDGGESLVVDGFAAALRLREEDPHGFHLLSTYPMRFEFKGAKGVHLYARRPMIEVSADGELVAIRFNSRSAASVRDVPFEEIEKWYAAYKRLSAIFDDPRMTIRFKLAPGEAFIVDNTRVLHAWTRFSGVSGKRWLIRTGFSQCTRPLKAM
uniref:TauD/TfdA-like domain-containing protein n=1 Tax=Chromera velia CCMP2878 TaxID=1169474 RepID=A0A0G4I8J6_9ALVE|eukprot:Cvel_11980.t1-p1 / transcript=Cvel_11980.t1 / gene=Cvel_11980 / organism=Chromera_velia_CCMP2878 / gene_product=Probable gamma-butyrobetaine dioxygenase, putative / transcript_product=Probable gamma-butyrobetaine dioxygenase, putative / location=Cvel_scaffold768:26382-32098(-) / protein_length=472 / sequence_SO=supercontig / SO=protein_coding / is_pseudo=false